MIFLNGRIKFLIYFLNSVHRRSRQDEQEPTSSLSLHGRPAAGRAESSKRQGYAYSVNLLFLKREYRDEFSTFLNHLISSKF